MGQFWKFLNIDKRQKLSPPGGWAKMGQFFFSHYPADVVILLMVPEGQTTNDQPNSNSWAGDRIICIGDYAEDWPPNIIGGDDCKRLESLHFMYKHALEIVANRDYPPKYGSSGVLRNLTKKIYVRAGGLPARGHTEPGLHFYKNPPLIDCVPGLGSVLLGRVGWSEDTGTNVCWDKAVSLAEGEWAGDRFDVRAFNDVKEELETDGWIDATEEEAQRTISIWKSEHPNE